MNAIAKKVALQYYQRIREVYIVKRNEHVGDPDGIGFTIDCTVVQTRRPCLPFDDAKTWFSGKHYIYCLKKEVVVNARTGTVAFIPPACPGSMHDLVVMRRSATTLNQLAGGSVILADKGYRGGEHNVPTLLVVTEDSPVVQRNKRVIVECFFGRLKQKYATLSRKWVLDEQSFDLFFDMACGFVNADILYHPLIGADRQVHLNIMWGWLQREEERQRHRAEINARYRARRNASYVETVLSIQSRFPLWTDLNP